MYVLITTIRDWEGGGKKEKKPKVGGRRGAKIIHERERERETDRTMFRTNRETGAAHGEMTGYTTENYATVAMTEGREEGVVPSVQ